jgi:hypothetical protein
MLQDVSQITPLVASDFAFGAALLGTYLVEASRKDLATIPPK